MHMILISKRYFMSTVRFVHFVMNYRLTLELTMFKKLRSTYNQVVSTILIIIRFVILNCNSIKKTLYPFQA